MLSLSHGAYDLWNTDPWEILRMLLPAKVCAP